MLWCSPHHQPAPSTSQSKRVTRSGCSRTFLRSCVTFPGSLETRLCDGGSRIYLFPQRLYRIRCCRTEVARLTVSQGECKLVPDDRGAVYGQLHPGDVRNAYPIHFRSRSCADCRRHASLSRFSWLCAI